MSERDSYPAGVPCWVETLQEDPQAAADFYGSLLGWEHAGSAADGDTFEYLVARLRGRDVAGIASLPDGLRPADGDRRLAAAGAAGEEGHRHVRQPTATCGRGGLFRRRVGVPCSTCTGRRVRGPRRGRE